jgi:hypothetical protein
MVWKITDEIFDTMAGEVRLTINGISMRLPGSKPAVDYSPRVDIPPSATTPICRRKASADSAW